jgi:large exoprotein involved in heme utilization and adhesion
VGTQGAAGNIIVTTPRLTMQEGRINTSTATSGAGGNVTINAGVIEMSGEFPNPDFGGFFGITNIHPSGIFTQTVGSEFCSGPCGNAGNINITAASLLMGAGSQINSGTTNTGHGGDITIHATDQISMSGALSNGDHVGIFSRAIGTAPDAGAGGNISLTAGQSVTISNGAAVSASSTGPGNTGNIQINAGNQFAMTNSSVTTEANQASGGTIKITTNPSGTVQLTNSTISASVLDGTGGGGSVNIDPQYVILQNSQILANAVQGPGGNITIAITNGGLFLPDANSTVSASSQFGVNGTVTIQSPNAPASGKIVPLSQKPLIPTSLLSQRCAALAGGNFSSFIVAGRDSLPTEPGGWLASPLAALNADARPAVRGEGREGMILGASLGGETPLLSLRQIAPAGFLTQAFAVDESSGCQS